MFQHREIFCDQRNETHIVVFVDGLPADLSALEVELFDSVRSDGRTLYRLWHEPGEVGVQVFEVLVRVVRFCNRNMVSIGSTNSK